MYTRLPLLTKSQPATEPETHEMNQPTISSARGAQTAAGDLAYHLIGRNPKTSAAIFIGLIVVLIVFIILFVVYFNKYKDCESGLKGGMLGMNPLGNLNTGSNNPMWQNQMGDAGWGGSMHSTYQPGESRVWGSSAEGGHNMAVAPVGIQSCGRGVSPAAMGEAQALSAVQALDSRKSSAKNMSDDDLIRGLNGGHV